ncbi:MAG: hypothetical protein J6U68_00450, partial [Clostridia bacterium]|nr:hypothetical protein [Clostridia bacterium]
MKKRILCFVLVMLMIFVTLPLSVFAEEGDEASGKNPPPVVSVSSRNPYPESDSGELGALPNKDGKFYFNIFLENVPTNYTEEVVVYYRTVDDSAVAKWGDYESVGFDASVTLTKDNDYTATVSVTSTVIDSGFYTDGKDGKPNEEKIISRRFIFELTSVAEDKFELSENNSKIYCYLRADVYNYQSNMGDMFGAKGNPVSRDLKEHFENFSSKPGSYWYEAVKENYYNAYEDLAEKIKYFSIYKTISGASALSTPRLQNGKQTSYRDSINLNFDEEWQNYVQSGWCDLGISIKGTITRKFWDSDGDTEFNLYYNIGGEKKLAMTLYLEGEFDDSTFFGWERAFEYLIDGNTLDNREDHVEDNFIGFTVYDNDGNVAYSVKNNGNIADIRNQLNTTLIQGNSARQAYETFSAYGRTRGDFLDEHYYLRMPSNFALADSYSYEFISRSTDDDEIRWLEDVMLSFTLMGNKDPIIEKDENNAQLVTTNLDTIKEGDRIRMSVRFDRPVHIADPNGNCYIIADICDNKGEVLANDVKLTLTQVGGTADNHYAWDTLVFESEKSIYELGLDGKKIASVRSISLHDGSEDDSTEGIKSFLSERKISNKTIDNIYVSRDFGTPVVSVSPENSNGSWIKSKSIKVSVYNKEDKGRFNDYVTVYYQWSDDSNDTFTTYSSKLTFHYREDGEAEKQIIETGSGEMYLHVKAVSSYGKSSDPLCFGPYKFDNDPPIMSAGYKSLGGTLKERALTVEVPKDDSDVRTMELYYVSKNGEGVLLKSFNINGQTSINCVIKHSEVKVGVGVEGAVVPDRQEISFYWRVTDTLGNVSEKSGEFKLVFDTNQYINTELDGAADYGDSDVKFATYTTEFGESFIYDYSDNKLADDKFPTYKETDKKVYYGFSFVMNETASNEVEYGAVVAYKGNDLKEDAYTVEKISDTAYVVWLHQRVESGRYDVHLTNGDSVSQVYSVYVTDGEKDTTAIKNKVEFGTLLSNKVYQLSSEYPNFYYKDKDGNIKTEYYTGTKNPATFSSYDKAKEYVYYRELSDIYLVQLSAETATALSGNAGGYQMADGETKEPEAGQCWIRYKRSSWTPTSGEGAWAYYYYGMSNVLNEDALPANLLKALNDVSKRIAGYGKTVILTDTSLFLGYVSGDKMLDSYGMPYLLPGQIYVNDELTARTKCENTWVNQVAFAADKNIYKSIVSIGEEGTENYREYPIVGSFTLPEDSIFQYKREENSTWTTLNIEKGKSFVDVFNASGVYYIREISVDGVSVYSIYIDKAAPDASFYKTNESGGFEEIPVNQKEILTITTKDLYLGSIDSVECDKQSYIAVYKASNFSLVATYTFGDLENTYIRLEDGNYYIVVSDRSGNHYTINAKVSSTPLECEIKETTNKNIKVTCNRNANQILRYEIYLNGELVTSTYSADQSFTDSGEYNIYIQDIYGNIFTRTYTFTRSYPTVTWKYCGADGKFHAYDSKDTNINGFTCKQISENQYKIDTAVKTRFSYIGEYEYEFIGVEPECEEKSDGSEIWVTIEEGQSFTVKIYYAKDEDCYVIYSGVVDVTPPS